MTTRRLSDREAVRVTVLAILPAFCLLPSLVRLVVPAETLVPERICAGVATRFGEDVRCEAGGTAVSPIRGLWAGTKLDLNSAEASALQIVPGIGPNLAARIVMDRTGVGPFRSVAELERVKGIGPKLRERMEAYVTVRPSVRAVRNQSH